MCYKANMPSINEEEIDIEQTLSTEDILAISQEIIVRNRKAYTELAQSAMSASLQAHKRNI